MENRIINLQLNISEVNFILGVLSEHPYKDVFELIEKIKEQGDKQIHE